MTEEISIKFNPSFYKKTSPENWNNIIKATTKDIALDLEKELKKTKFKKPTGNLNRNHHAVVNGFQAEIKNRTKYWGYPNYGTKAHDITPKNKNALYWKGAKHPVPLVHHPGIKPMKFTTKAINRYMNSKKHVKSLQKNMKSHGVV